MGIVQNVIGMVRGINDRKRAARVDDQLKNYLTDPNAAIAAVMDIDPQTGIKLSKMNTADTVAAEERKRSRLDADLGYVTRYMRGLPEDADIGAEFDQMSPFFEQTLGMAPDRVAAFRRAALANPRMLMDDEAYKNFSKDENSTTVVTPGSIALRGGREVARAPYKMEAKSTAPGAVTVPFDPNTGQFVTEAGPSAGGGAPGPLTVDALRPHFVSQESSDNYTARNAETGALGRYQIMPETGMALAKRLGLAWRPAMMTRDDPASRRYQDALGNAAIQESIDFGQGDAATTFAHYYGGPDRRKWGPKTRKYVDEMLARYSGGGAAAQPEVSPTKVAVPPKPAAEKRNKNYRTATAEELAGYPPGTAGQVEVETGKLVNIKTPPAGNLKAKEQAEARANSLVDTLTLFNKDIEHLRDHPGLKMALGYIAGHVPKLLLGQDGTDAVNLIENIRQRTGLNQLMAFKATSAQGASGFGNLSNEEGRRLEAAYGTLERTSSYDEFVRTLNTMLRSNAAVLRRQVEGFKGLAAERRAAKGEQPGGRAAPVGTVVRVGNGRKIKTENGWEDYNGR